VNTTIIADKQADDSPFIMRFKDSTGGFFHNTVVTVAGNATGTSTSAHASRTVLRATSTRRWSSTTGFRIAPMSRVPAAPV
jgi:hypothetical protein